MSIEPSFHHEAAQAQLNRTAALAKKLGVGKARIGSSHTSKSITLPVPTIELPAVSFTFRDNFHDLNLLVESKLEIKLPLSFFYEPLTFDWYMETIARKQNYCFFSWSEEEMNDPRILRVQRKRGTPGWQEIKGDEKDRWLNRMTSTDWHGRDWGSDLIAVGPSPFTAETTFYRTDRAYAEGIKSSANPYSGPCKTFMNCVHGWDTLTRLCLGIAEHLKSPNS